MTDAADGPVPTTSHPTPTSLQRLGVRWSHTDQLAPHLAAKAGVGSVVFAPRTLRSARGVRLPRPVGGRDLCLIRLPQERGGQVRAYRRGEVGLCLIAFA